MKPIAWIGIGCGVVILIAVIAVLGAGIFVYDKASDFVEDLSENPAATIAENIVRFNPELELVESDREGGTITIREKSSGKELTFDYEDIEEGRFSFESSDGEKVSFDARGEDGVLRVETEDGTTTFGATGSGIELPEWLPAYGNVSGEAAGFTAVNDDTATGTVTFETSDDLEQVMEFYEEVLNGLGVDISRGTFSASGTQTTTVSGSSETHSLQVTGHTTDGKRSVNIVFSGPS